jgi:hypothetical protein
MNPLSNETLIIKPPPGSEFKECEKCKNPFICTRDEDKECLWCLINGEELVKNENE